jgi:hypothetical protein
MASDLSGRVTMPASAVGVAPEIAENGVNRRMSLRLAPSIVQPMGTPWRSDATDHFQPNFARSVGFGSVPSPP